MYIDRCEFPIQERIEVTTKNNRVYVFASFEIDLPFDIG